MQTIINLILLQIIIVFIIDLSGIIPTIKHIISSYLTKKQISTDNFSIRPLDCSLCMMHWIGLIYIVCVDFSMTNYCIICILSLLTTPIANLLLSIKDRLNNIL